METISSIIDRNQIGTIDHRLSIIDKEETRTIDNRSSIDNDTNRIKTMLGDSTLGEQYIRLALNKLGMGKVYGIAEYCVVKANRPGRAFIAICQKELKKR